MIPNPDKTVRFEIVKNKVQSILNAFFFVVHLEKCVVGWLLNSTDLLRGGIKAISSILFSPTTSTGFSVFAVKIAPVSGISSKLAHIGAVR